MSPLRRWVGRRELGDGRAVVLEHHHVPVALHLLLSQAEAGGGHRGRWSGCATWWLRSADAARRSVAMLTSARDVTSAAARRHHDQHDPGGPGDLRGHPAPPAGWRPASCTRSPSAAPSRRLRLRLEQAAPRAHGSASPAAARTARSPTGGGHRRRRPAAQQMLPPRPATKVRGGATLGHGPSGMRAVRARTQARPQIRSAGGSTAGGPAHYRWCAARDRSVR